MVAIVSQRRSQWLPSLFLILLAMANVWIWSLLVLNTGKGIVSRQWFKATASIPLPTSLITEIDSTASPTQTRAQGNVDINTAPLDPTKPLLVMALLDIGQGDAIYIESPTGNQMLVDGGPDAALLSQLERIMPPQDTTIDVLLITNPDKDHLGGFIDALMRYSVGLVVEPGTITKTRVYTYLKDVAARRNVTVVRARRGMEFDLGGGAAFFVLYPQGDVSKLSTNEGSIVGVLSFGSTTALLTGDAPVVAEEKVLAQHPALDVDILKVGHHGSRTSTSNALLKRITPQVALISAGKGNTYGHPHKEVTDRLKAFHIPYFVTAKEGPIIYVSDGSRFYRVGEENAEIKSNLQP